jgi:hypothetical protein
MRGWHDASVSDICAAALRAFFNTPQRWRSAASEDSRDHLEEGEMTMRGQLFVWRRELRNLGVIELHRQLPLLDVQKIPRGCVRDVGDHRRQPVPVDIRRGIRTSVRILAGDSLGTK